MPTPSFGVADDAGKYAEDGGAASSRGMRSVGLSDEPDHRPVGRRRARRRSSRSRSSTARCRSAAARGIHVVFALYPTRADALTASPDGARAVRRLGRSCSRARTRRSRTSSSATSRTRATSGGRSSRADGTPVAAATFLPVLAASYDALKAVDPAIRVTGVGLSERGNDNPKARRATSRRRRSASSATSAPPTARAAGRRRSWTSSSSTRTRRPRPTTCSKSYAWPSAGFGNLDRVKQALWDAFARHRTADRRGRAEDPHRRDRLAVGGARVRCRRRTPAARTSPPPTRGTRRRSTARSCASPRAIRRSRSVVLLRPRRRAAARPLAGRARCARTTARSRAYHIVREAITTTERALRRHADYLAAHDERSSARRAKFGRPRPRRSWEPEGAGPSPSPPRRRPPTGPASSGRGRERQRRRPRRALQGVPSRRPRARSAPAGRRASSFPARRCRPAATPTRSSSRRR